MFFMILWLLAAAFQAARFKSCIRMQKIKINHVLQSMVTVHAEEAQFLAKQMTPVL